MLDFGRTPADFNARHLEGAAYLQRGALSARPFEWPDIDALLHQIEPRAPVMQLYRDGLVDEASYTTGIREFGGWRRRLLKQRFYALMREGATLVINRLESHSVHAKRLCDEVAHFTGHPVASNAYLSFRGSGTFGTHWDTHEVFAVQLLGRKRWQVFAPTFPLPLPAHRSDQFPGARPTTPVLDCVLEQGDLLYIPRGHWHRVEPMDEGSFHLSVGVYVPTVFDYLMWACNAHLPQMPAARRGLHGTGDEQAAAVLASLRSLQERALDPASLAGFLTEMASRAAVAPDLDLGLFVAGQASGLREDSSLALAAWPLREDGRGAVLGHGGWVPLDALGRAVVTLLSASSSLTLAELQGRSQLPPRALRECLLLLVRQEVVTIT